MKKYEYKVVVSAAIGAMTIKQYEKSAQELEMKLNELGKEGWEFVQRMDGFLFLKRELVQG